MLNFLYRLFGRGTILRVKSYRQWRLYSCGAAAVQAVVRFLAGHCLSHKEAIDLTDARPEGCTFWDIKWALESCALKTKLYKKRMTGRAVEKAIDNGKLIVTDRPAFLLKDCRHALVIIGYVSGYFIVIDPVFGLPIPRLATKLLKNATTFLVAEQKKR